MSQYQSLDLAPQYGETAQQQSSNVLVVNQPTGTSSPAVVYTTTADDYLCCSVTLCVLCFITGNWLALMCAFPACIISCIASTHNDAGDYEMARRLGSLACKFNICTILPSVIMIIAVVGGTIIGILVAVKVIGAAANNNNEVDVGITMDSY